MLKASNIFAVIRGLKSFVTPFFRAVGMFTQ
jgi:hypothetical protein